ncbi:MAG: VOC family protein [Planctomycetaceae bacterium]|nr:VOC family protein [Planctomycetaceae bacterium]
MAVQPVPPGYHTVTPYLIINGAARALEFYKKAFGAEERFRMADPSGNIGHAEIQIGDSMVMLADEHPQMGFKGPPSPGATPVSMHLYVEDVDAMGARAIAAGATVMRPIQDQFYGDRSGTFLDPFGHVWTIATHKEDIAPDEMARRAQAAMKSKQQG